MIERVLLAGVVALAYLAPWPLLVNGWARLTGDPAVYAHVVDTETWAHHALFLALFLVVAAYLWATDRWLAGIVAMAGVQTFVMGPHVTTIYLLIGVGAIVAGRALPRVRREAPTWLGIAAVFQSLVIVAQWWKGLPPVGTFGISGVAAGFVAMGGVLLPGWFLPIIAVGVALTGSRAGILALVVGIAVRYVPAWPVVIGVLAVMALAVLAYGAWTPLSGSARAAVVRHAYLDWRDSSRAILVGYGLGTWRQRFPRIMDRVGVDHFGEGPAAPRYYHTAHNDAVQWVYETGALGALLLAGWFVRWRRCLTAPPLSPAFAVLAVMALTWFPFHDLRIGIPAALLVGVGTPLLNEGA